MTRHGWIRGGVRADREALIATMSLPPALMAPVDAHRRLRGPYTAAGTIVGALTGWALDTAPDLVHRHDLELLTVAPELRQSVPASRETLTSLAVPEERTRFYSRLRTLRIAHGLVEFLRDLPLDGPRSLVIENLDHADPTDAEFVSVLMRRIDPARLSVTACSTAALDGPLAGALVSHADAFDASSGPRAADETDGHVHSAGEYVQGECVSDDPGLLTAYLAATPVERAQLHDRRAEELQAVGEQTLALGAIPFHRERGSDPVAAANALRAALDYCIDMGFYNATVDLGVRGRKVVDWEREPEHWWAFTTKMTTSLAALGRPAEAEALYDEARVVTSNPQVHLQAAYATAMLYTRHHEAAQRDHLRAMGWINEAIALASLDPDPRKRAFQVVFNRNGLALIQVHLNNLPEALKLVEEGLAELDRTLGPDDHRLHRSVLRYNRGQVYTGLGRLEDALADYTAVIRDDPNYPEYYFDRGNLLRRIGRDDEALADYEAAIRLSPPFPEVYYNRGDLRYSHDDHVGALADFSYVTELDPDFVDAYVNRASLLVELDRLDEARRDVSAGLIVDPHSAHLHCLLGQLECGDGATDAARSAFDAAIDEDPTLQAAWAGRATIAYERGDIAGALADLDRALELGDLPELRSNRATVLAAAERWSEALADIDQALRFDPQDPDLHEHRTRYFSQLATT